MDAQYPFCSPASLEAFLGRKVVRLYAKAGFGHWADMLGG